jgi:LPXTG-site transpeptidase (sortase) family protein
VPGEGGNAVFAGHRDSFFRPLRHVRVGDDVFVDTSDGRFHYRVASTHVVGPRDLSVVAPTDEEVLTLITCYPFWLIGNAPDRFVVRATRVVEVEAHDAVAD